MTKKLSFIAIYLFFLIVCLCVYFNSLNNAFIYDDNPLIVKNLYIRQLSFIPRLFTIDSFHFQHPGDSSLGVYYRPLESVSYAVDYFFWKLKPFGYHLTNIILHSLNSFLSFLLIYLLFKDKALALLSAVLFAVHPVHLCVVSFIAGRVNILETLFMFLSLLWFTGFYRYKRRRYFLLSLLSFIFAVLSREGGLILPVFILLTGLFLKINKKKLLIYLSPYFLICVLYLILRSSFIPCDKLDLFSLFSFERIIAFVRHAQAYVGQIILPVQFQEIFFNSSFQLKSALFFLSLIFTGYVLVKAIIYKEKIVIFALYFYIIGLLPLIKLTDAFGYLGLMNTEHYIYKSSLAFFIITAYFLLKKTNPVKRLMKVLCVLIVCIFSLLTIKGNAYYKDEWTYYNFVSKVDKDDIFIRINLANLYLEKKMYDKAMKEAEVILSKEPLAWDAHLLLGNIYNAQGNALAAARLFEETLKLYPRSVEALNNLGLIAKAQGRQADAENYFTSALRINPEYLLSLNNYCIFLVDNKLYDKALVVCGKILQMDKSDTHSWVRFGVILAELGRFKESEAALKYGLKLEPGSFDALNNLAALYGNSGNFNKAILLWEKALLIRPNDQQLKENIKAAKKMILNE